MSHFACIICCSYPAVNGIDAVSCSDLRSFQDSAAVSITRRILPLWTGFVKHFYYCIIKSPSHIDSRYHKFQFLFCPISSRIVSNNFCSIITKPSMYYYMIGHALHFVLYCFLCSCMQRYHKSSSA